MSRRPGHRRPLAAAMVLFALLVAGQPLLTGARPADAAVKEPIGRRAPMLSTAPSPVETELDVQAAALSPVELNGLLDKLARDRITTVSTGANWASLQPTAGGPYDWAGLDAVVTGATARGLKVRLRLSTTPSWVHPERVVGASDADARWYPPVGATELAAWRGFVQAVVSRYGSQLSGIEAWNEPNEQWFWKPSPDPAQFAALLRETWQASKAVRPSLSITSGGISHNDVGFLTRTYQELSRYPEAAASRFFFDMLGVHPYSADRSPDVNTASAVYQGTFGTVDENFGGLSRLQQVMSAAGDPGKKLWISEYGFSTAGTRWFGPVPDDRRALFLLRAFDRIGASGNVAGLGWYHSHPTPWDLSDYDILGRGLTETATYRAVKQITGASPRLTLSAPARDGSRLKGVLRLGSAATASVPALRRSELFVDGWLKATGSRDGMTWDSRSVSNGTHTLVLAAYSESGETWASVPVTVTVSN